MRWLKIILIISRGNWEIKEFVSVDAHKKRVWFRQIFLIAELIICFAFSFLSSYSCCSFVKIKPIISFGKQLMKEASSFEPAKN